MAASALDTEIDELYQLPPDQFTAARNDLAKRVDAADKATVRALRKPSLAAWAVNQLYWRSRRTWDALVRAAEQLREAHRSAMRGAAGDLRKADAAHREAIARAVKETMALVSAAGPQPSAALKDAVVRTLQALPADIAPGRLDAALESAGFGVLEGMTPSRAAKPAPVKTAAKPAAPPAAGPRAKVAPIDRVAERRREMEARKAQAEAEKEAQRARAEAERQRREEEERAATAAKRIAHLTLVLARAQKEEDDLRERLARATEERKVAEEELSRAKR